MGFFDKILSAIGFENDDETSSKPSKEKKSKKENITNAKFDLSKNQEPQDKELSRFGSNKQEKKEEDLEVFTPETQSEIENILIKVKNGENVLINLSAFSDEDRIRALDFVSGALFILQKNIKRVEGTLFLIN